MADEDQSEDNGAERTEEVVSRIMRGARDVKIRLDTTIEQQSRQIAALNARITEMDRIYVTEIAKVSTDRDRWMRRAVQLETDTRAMVAQLNDALRGRTVWEEPNKTSPPDDGEPSPAFLHRNGREPVRGQSD